LKKWSIFSLVACLVIAFVLASGCSEMPGVQPGSTVPAGDTPATFPAAPDAATPAQPATVTPLSSPLSLSCPGGYVPGGDGDSRCYAQCNPDKRCADPDDFCCGTNCCSPGSVCCGGNCYQGPCACSESACRGSYGETTGSYVERPSVVINGPY
jgi:hypothetical protein